MSCKWQKIAAKQYLHYRGDNGSCSDKVEATVTANTSYKTQMKPFHSINGLRWQCFLNLDLKEFALWLQALWNVASGKMLIRFLPSCLASISDASVKKRFEWASSGHQV